MLHFFGDFPNGYFSVGCWCCDQDGDGEGYEEISSDEANLSDFDGTDIPRNLVCCLYLTNLAVHLLTFNLTNIYMYTYETRL